MHVVNRTDSPFGDGWSLPGLDELFIQDILPGQPDGVALLTGNNELIWFGNPTENEDTIHTDYAREENPSNFSQLQRLDSTGTFTLTDPNGTIHNFDSLGKLTTVVDRNGNILDSYTYATLIVCS